MGLPKFKSYTWKLIITALSAVIITGSSFFLQQNKSQLSNNRELIDSIIYSNNFHLNLTKEEQIWLKTHPVVHLGIDRAFPPFGTITDDNQYIGFTADIMQMISYRLGFTFFVEKNTPWDKTIAMAKTGQIDMIAGLVKSKERQEYLEFSKPYIKTPTIIINNSVKHGYIGTLENLKGQRVAIEKGSYAANEIAKKYPDIKLIAVENTSIALSLVAIGDADAYVGNAVTASFIIRKLAYHNLSFSGETEYSSNHSIGIIKPNRHLSSIINKALNSISKNSLDSITNYWFGMRIHPFISKNTTLIIIAVLSSFIVLFGIWIISLRRTKRALKESQEALKDRSEIDYLTGLGNRRKFYQYLNQKIENNTKQSQSFSLLFLDLDLFKEVNDSLGHDVGDLLLAETSKRIQKCVENFNGFVARIGGDEFIIILSGICDKAVIDTAAECIRTSIGNSYYINDNKINITCSIGVTRYPEDANTAKQLVINGDQAMYQSKKLGRNCYSYFNINMLNENNYKINLIKDLRAAINEEKFMLYYQPIIDFSTDTITKIEALIRWNHPERGFVSPSEFIPLAEETGLINSIGDWTFKQAIDDNSAFCNQFDRNFQITINTSPLQFRRNGINFSFWDNYLKSKGLSGKNIIVEITEGILMETSQAVKDNLLQLQERNIDIAIDDFGTGYSSLSYFKKFDVDYLKIDQSFIKNMTSDPNDIALVQAIIAMSHQLDIKVIAEGIETQEQRDILINAGCDYGQGFYFSKALNKKELLAFLENWNCKKGKQLTNVIKH